MSKGTTVPLGLAQTLGKTLVNALKPFTEEILIAGSVRRGKALVHDLEIVALAREYQMNALFGQRVALERTAIDDALGNMEDSNLLAWRLEKDGKVYKKLRHLNTGLTCDFYVVTDERAWGSWVAVRTGPRNFSIHIMRQARKLDMFFSNGFLLHNHMPHRLRKNNRGHCPDGASCDKIIPLRREADLFEALKIQYIKPDVRDERYGVG